MIALGDTYKFRPHGLDVHNDGSLAHLPGRPRYVTGTVDYINEAHRFFRVRYELWVNELHECFKF